METITKANKKSIREFAYEAFSHILSAKLTDVPEKRRPILQNLINILSEEFNGKMHYFTKPIFKSVCVTQKMLKDYFAPFFTINFYNHFRSTFINDFKLVLLHWLQQRDNVFVKIIDSLAVFTEAFLYCLYYKEFPSSIKNITEELINLFEEIFPSEFFHKGGWGRLNEKAEMWYQNLYSEYCIKEIVVDYCKFVSFLRQSTVMFPVPQHWLCEKCKIPQDESMTRQITYVIPDYEFLSSLDNKNLGEICSDLEKISVEKRIECVKSEGHFVENEKHTHVERKYSSDTGIENVCAANDSEKLLKREKDSVITVKCSVDPDYNSTNGRIGSINAGKIDVDNGKHPIDDGKHTTHDEKYLTVDEKNPEGDEKNPEGDEKDHIDSVNASRDSKKNLSKEEQRNNNCSKDKKTVKEDIHSTVAAISEKPYNSDSTQEMNQNLLEGFIGKGCRTGRTENIDFLFIAEKYSHSVEKMVKELSSAQFTNTGKLSDIIQEIKTSDNNIPNLDARFFFRIAYVFVSIGGTKNKTKRGNKNRKKNLLKEL